MKVALSKEAPGPPGVSRSQLEMELWTLPDAITEDSIDELCESGDLKFKTLPQNYENAKWTLCFEDSDYEDFIMLEKLRKEIENLDYDKYYVSDSGVYDN